MKRVMVAEECICCESRSLTRSPAVLMPFVAKRVFDQEPLEITADWGMRDLKQGTAYALCNSLQCQDCSALFLDYRFSEDQMAALYRGYRNEAYTRERDRFEPGYADTVAQDYRRRHAYIDEVETWLAPRLPKRPVVLDWGGGDGTNSPFLGKTPTLEVFDISGVPVVAGASSVSACDIVGRRYELVVCSQVLEHVPAPIELIRQILPALSPASLIYLEVPHEDLVRSHPGRRDLAPLKRHWHEHVNFYTEEAMLRLLERAGLTVLDVLRLPIDNGARQGEVMGLLARRSVTTRAVGPMMD